MLRLVSYASQAPDLVVPSTVPADGAAEIAVAGTWAPATAKVIDPGPERARSCSSGRRRGCWDSSIKHPPRGITRSRPAAAGLEPPQAAAAAFAVNTAPEESDFQTVTEDQVRQWLPTAQLTFVERLVRGRADARGAGEEREIWRPHDHLALRPDRCGIPAGDHEPPYRDRGPAADPWPETRVT